MLNHPNLAPWPFHESDEIEAAMHTLNTGKVNYWTGDLGKSFEQSYARHVGKKYGVALSNGTVALELALRALGIGAGDEVIVASRSYVASASCVVLVGATPVFADVDCESGNITVQMVAPLITKNTKAIIPVHVGGWPCDMQGIMALANQYGLKIIEDCAQAHGAIAQGKPVGAWGHAAIFSFCQDKIISTGGEGGMLLLDDEQAYKEAWAYKDIGRSYDAVFNRAHPAGFRWLTESAGSNFRMTEFQAAIGLKQLEKLPVWIETRNAHARVLVQVLQQYSFIDVSTVNEGAGNKSACYRLYAKVNTGVTIDGRSGAAFRDDMINQFVSAGVPCFSGSCAEIYREKLFSNIDGIPRGRLPNAAVWADNAFCFLVHHTITSEQITQMADRIQNVLSSFKL